MPLILTGSLHPEQQCIAFDIGQEQLADAAATFTESPAQFPQRTEVVTDVFLGPARITECLANETAPRAIGFRNHRGKLAQTVIGSMGQRNPALRDRFRSPKLSIGCPFSVSRHFPIASNRSNRAQIVDVPMAAFAKRDASVDGIARAWLLSDRLGNASRIRWRRWQFFTESCRHKQTAPNRRALIRVRIRSEHTSVTQHSARAANHRTLCQGCFPSPGGAVQLGQVSV